MFNRQRALFVLAVLIVIGTPIYVLKFSSNPNDEGSKNIATSPGSKPAEIESSGGFPSGDQSTSTISSAPSHVDAQINAQQAGGNTGSSTASGSQAGESLSTDQSRRDMQAPSQGSITSPPAQRSFKGIKQANNDVMVSEIKYDPGDSEDGFVATFQSGGGAKAFDGNVWIIGDYVQRGTTGIMAMPSHSELKIEADGSPANPKGGLRLTVSGARSESVSRKFSIKRPGFDGEELSQIRIGIYDRSTGKVHVAKVSAAELAKKRSTKRVKVDGAN